MANFRPTSAANISAKTPCGGLGHASCGERVGVTVSVERSRAGVRVIAAIAVVSIVALGIRVAGLVVDSGRRVGIKEIGDGVGRGVVVVNWKGVVLGCGVIVSTNAEHPVTNNTSR